MQASRFRTQSIILLLIFPAFGRAQSQARENATFSQSGFVLVAIEDRPVGHAHVGLLNPSNGLALSAITDSDGKFEFAGLPPANYQVTVEALGYEQLGSSVRIDGSTQPLLFHLHKASQPATPRNDSVVSVQELRMSEKAESAFARGTRMLQKGDAKQSLVFFQKALAKEPGYYQAYHNLGLAHYQLGETALAEEDFQKSIDLTNGGYAPSQFALAMILCEKHEFGQAERLIQNGLAMDPGSAVGKYFLGLVQFALNRTAEAEKSARDALWRSADQFDAHILLAKIHELDHNPRAVVADVAAYLKLDPHGPLQVEANQLLQKAQMEIDQQETRRP